MFILLPTGMDYRTRRYPVVTFTIMGLCTAVYLVTLFYTLGADNPKEAHKWVFEHLWLIPSESHWWTYITSVFVHAGIMPGIPLDDRVPDRRTRRRRLRRSPLTPARQQDVNRDAVRSARDADRLRRNRDPVALNELE